MFCLSQKKVENLIAKKYFEQLILFINLQLFQKFHDKNKYLIRRNDNV